VIEMRIVHALVLVLLVPALFQVGAPAQTYTTDTTITSLMVFSQTQSSIVSIGVTTLTGLTTSAYAPSAGTIPASYTSSSTGQQVCFYVPYHFHVYDSVSEVVGSVSASSPFNFYIMSQSQYDGFVAGNPPCGSSYEAITLGYMEKSFTVSFAPGPGDYYIIVENIASSSITYSIELSAIATPSSVICSTTEGTQLMTNIATFSEPVLPTYQSQPTTHASSALGLSFTELTFIALIIAGLGAAFIWSKRRSQSKEQKTRVY